MQIDQTVEFKMPRTMAAQIGHYVYLYLDPDTGAPLYVGKGQGQRILAHLVADGDCDKGRKMRAMRNAGKQPVLRFVRHGLSAAEALLVEASLIDVFGLDNLLNKVAGQGSVARGSISFEQLRANHVREPISIADPVVMIRVFRTFRFDMSAEELFEATCGTWKTGAGRDQVRYALAVHDDIVHEVFEIESWQHRCTRRYRTRDLGGLDTSRWEFNGKPVVEGAVRERYLHRNLSALFSKGSQNPIRDAFPPSEVPSPDGDSWGAERLAGGFLG